MFVPAILLLASVPGPGQDWTRVELASPLAKGMAMVVRTNQTGLAEPKPDPKNKWLFDQVSVVAYTEGLDEFDRFRVFGQSPLPSPPCPAPPSVGRFLARLYDFNSTVLHLDHSMEFAGSRVDIYLCREGKAGGEQFFGEDPYTMDSYSHAMKANMVYIYDVGTLTNPLEACRELAHEYGHATLPPVKVPNGREQWANGDLGERIYLPWIRDQLTKGRILPEDALGASADGLQKYWERRVRPLVLNVAKSGPGLSVLKRTDDRAFDAYLALACYARQVLPEEAFRRSLVLNPDRSAFGYSKAVLEVTNERPKVRLAKPDPSLTEYWVPVGTGTVAGAKVLLKAGGWAKVHPTGQVVIVNSPQK